jgi:hypothetical protein
MVPPCAEEVPAVATAAEVLITPPAPVTGAEEVGTIAEASTTQVVMGAPNTAGPDDEEMVVAMDADSAAPLSSESHDIVIPLEPGATLAAAVTSSLPAVRVSGPSPAVETSGPPPTAEMAETSSDQITLTVEEVMELATCRYIDFPGVGWSILKAPVLEEGVRSGGGAGVQRTDDQGDACLGVEGDARIREHRRLLLSSRG